MNDSVKLPADTDLYRLGEHIDYISRVINERISDEGKRQELIRSLRKIQKKQNDKLLNMSVIGEFSTGKSSFINGLLRSELLATCSLQGTTVANTVIEYGKTYASRVRFADSIEAKKTEFADIRALSAGIETITTDPKIARHLSGVTILLPSENIRDRFRIIDTPGTNSLEKWHEEVTVSAINDVSDLSVIITDATRLFPESFCNFLRSTLTPVLPQCVFVLTKFDLVPKREHKQLMSFAAKKIKTEFGIDSPLILPYSATAVMDGDTDNEFYRLSFESEERLIQHMSEQKTAAQKKKLVALTDRLYTSLSEDMKLEEAECDEKLRLLEQSKQADLEAFVHQQKYIRRKNFLSEIDGQRRHLSNYVATQKIRAVNNILDRVNSQTNLDALKKYTSEDMEKECIHYANQILSCLSVAASPIEKRYSLEIQRFEGDFSDKFRDLKLLEVDLSRIVQKSADNGRTLTVNTGAALNYLGEQTKKEGHATIGGAAAGAALGTMIAPGVGTVIGGIAGALFGGFFTPSFESVKQETLKKLQPSIDSCFDKVENDILTSYDEYTDSMVIRLSTEIGAYLKAYRELVNRRIASETQRKQTLQGKKEIIERTLSEITQRRAALLSAVSEPNN